MGPDPASGTSRSAPRSHPDHPTHEQVAVAVQAFSLLADPTRVRLLWAIRDGGVDVTTLARTAGCSPTVASQHLAKLRLGGLVEGERDGRHVRYRIRGGHVRRLLEEALFQADHLLTGEPVHD